MREKEKERERDRERERKNEREREIVRILYLLFTTLLELVKEGQYAIFIMHCVVSYERVTYNLKSFIIFNILFFNFSLY